MWRPRFPHCVYSWAWPQVSTSRMLKKVLSTSCSLTLSLPEWREVAGKKPSFTQGVEDATTSDSEVEQFLNTLLDRPRRAVGQAGFGARYRGTPPQALQAV